MSDKGLFGYLTMSDNYINSVDNVRVMAIMRIMRDGIYKTCPVSVSWRRVLHLATRPADWGPRLREAMEDALHADIKRDRLKKQVAYVHAMLSSGQISLFSILEDNPVASNLPLPTSQMAQDFQDQLEFGLSRFPQSIEETVIDASTECLKRHNNSMVLELIGHIYKNSSENSAEAIETIRALRESQRELNYRFISESFLSGIPLISLKKQEPKFNLDENLL